MVRKRSWTHITQLLRKHNTIRCSKRICNFFLLSSPLPCLWTTKQYSQKFMGPMYPAPSRKGTRLNLSVYHSRSGCHYLHTSSCQNGDVLRRFHRIWCRREFINGRVVCWCTVTMPPLTFPFRGRWGPALSGDVKGQMTALRVLGDWKCSPGAPLAPTHQLSAQCKSVAKDGAENFNFVIIS